MKAFLCKSLGIAGLLLAIALVYEYVMYGEVVIAASAAMAAMHILGR